MDPKQISFSHLCHSPLDSGYCIFLLLSSKISFVIGTFIFKASSLQTTARPKETSSTAPVWGLEVNRREDTGTGLLGTGISTVDMRQGSRAYLWKAPFLRYIWAAFEQGQMAGGMSGDKQMEKPQSQALFILESGEKGSFLLPQRCCSTD